MNIEDYNDEGSIHALQSNHRLDVLLKSSSTNSIIGSEEDLNHSPREKVSINISHEDKKQSLFGLPIEKFKSDKESDDNMHSINETDESPNERTICIPPWAKTLRKSQDNISKSSQESTGSIRLKIRNIMKNYNDAILVKRVENQDQLILEPSSDNKNVETIKRTKTNTRYYLAPLHKSDERILKHNTISNTVSDSANKSQINDNISDVTLDSKAQAKKDVSKMLNSLKMKSDGNNTNLIKNKFPPGTQRKVSCPKITVNQIRSYVENKMLDPNERQLHEIITVQRVPSKTMIRDQNHGRQYTINMPKGDVNDINVVKIKEKRKLQMYNLEETNGEDNHKLSKSKLQTRGENDCTTVKYSSRPDKSIKKVEKSPLETRVFEVKTMKTPIISPLIDENKKDKMLLIEHEINYKPKHKGPGIPTTNLKKTQLLGIKQHCAEMENEIYMYDTETNGKCTKENINKIEVVSPSLKQKVNSIFEELKGITFRQKTPEPISPKPHVSSGTNTEENQYLSSNMLGDRLQSPHEVKSASIQVQECELLRNIYSKEVLSKYSTISLSKELPISKTISKELSKDASREKLDSFKEAKSLDLLPKTSISDTRSTLKTKNLEDLGVHHIMSKEQASKDYLTKPSEMSSDIGQVNLIDKVKDSLKDATDSHRSITVRDDREEPKDKHLYVDYKKELNEDDQINKEIIDELTQDEQKVAVTLEISDQKLLPEKLVNEYDYKQQPSKVEKEEDKYDNVKLQQEIHTDTLISQQKDLQTKSSFSVKSPKDELLLPSPKESFKSPSTLDQKNLLLQDNKIDSDVSIPEKSFRFNEDIISYTIDPAQDKEFIFKSDSKFIHKKESIRKRMNWTDNTIYLENMMCPQIITALAETAMRTPPAPISYLANLIYKDYQNKAKEEEKYVFQEHLNLARSMKGLSENRE